MYGSARKLSFVHQELAADHLLLGLDVQQVREAENERQVGNMGDLVQPLLGAEHRLVLDDDRPDARERRVGLCQARAGDEPQSRREEARGRRHQAVYPPSTNTVEPVT